MSNAPNDRTTRNENRISSLESKYNLATGVIGALVVIFGISGAWGAWVISSANREITSLQDRASHIKEEYERYSKALDGEKSNAIKDIDKSVSALARERTLEQSAKLIEAQNGLEAELQKQNDALSKQIEERVEKLKTGLESIPVNGGNGRIATCPNGTFMTSMLILSNGPAQPITWMQPVCRAMQ